MRCRAETFGRIDANKICRRAPQFGNKWHLDEVVISINGKMQRHVRAVDADGFVLDALFQSREDRRSGQALAQVDTKAIPHTARDGHRQARCLWSGPDRDGHDLRASPAQGSQQPGREEEPFAPLRPEDRAGTAKNLQQSVCQGKYSNAMSRMLRRSGTCSFAQYSFETTRL